MEILARKKNEIEMLFVAQICFFAVLPLLTGVWALCLLREHGILSIDNIGQKFKNLPGGKMLHLVMAAAAIAYGGSKGGSDDPDPTPAPPVVTNFVEFVANGGEGNMATQTFVYGEAQALSSNLFTRAGCDFVGWATSAAGSVVYEDCATVSNLSDEAGAVVPLYARWAESSSPAPDPTPTPDPDPDPTPAPPVVTNFVEFVANGGEGNMATQTFVYGEAQALSSNLFTRVGYRFDGWGTSTTGGAAYVDCQTITVTTNINLYAHWTNNTYELVFDLNGGGARASEMVEYDKWKSVAAPSRVGYVFAGWEVSGHNLETAIFSPMSDFSEAMTNDLFVAIPSVATGSMSFINLNAGTDGDTNTTLTALWTANTYDVSFNANGGSGSMATQSFVYGEAQTLLSNRFERATYDFDGWATSAAGTVMYADRAIVSNLSSTAGATVPMYAHWTRTTNAYDVSFHPNGGQGTMEPQAFVIDQPQRLVSNQFWMVGYDFAGWAISTNGGVVYADCQIVTNVTTNAGEVISLYATWERMSHSEFTTNINGITWHYAVTNGEATIVNNDGVGHVTAVSPQTITRLSVPEFLYEGTNACPVTAVAENAFMGLSSLVEIIVPASVSQIDSRAFSGCGKIERATLPAAVVLSSLMPDSYRSLRYVEVHGVDGFLEEGVVAVEDAAFAGCTSLEEVVLPLGVSALPANCFSGCSSLVAFEMPYTVTSIGERAFAGCTALTALTVTENVREIGANAFTDCSSLKIVRYLGDEPGAEEGGAGNIYYHANASLVSGYLSGVRDWPSAPVMETVAAASATDTDSSDASSSTSNTKPSTTTTYTPAKWPSGDAGRPLLAWNNKLYSFKKVTLDYNDGGKTPVTNRLYVTGRVLGDLPEPDGDGDFAGWFTERYGGREADPYTVVDSAITFYAHWSGDSSGTGSRGPVNAFDPLYDLDDGAFAFTAATFNGLLISDDAVVGTIQVKTKKGRNVVSTNGNSSAFNAAVNVLGSKKVSLSGSIGADGSASVSNEGMRVGLELAFTQFGLSGRYSSEMGDYTIIGARDRYSATSDEAKGKVRVALGNAKRNWSVVLPTESADGDGAAFSMGYSVLAISVGNKGKAKITGTMADGSKVSVSSNLIVGDSCCCLPVVVPLYTGKSGGFSFAVWFTWPEDASERLVQVAGLSGWEATKRQGGGFTAEFGEPLVGEAGVSRVPSSVSFQIEDFFDVDGVYSELSPVGTEIDASGNRWRLPKADDLKFSKEDGWYTLDGKDHGNPAGLRLTYTAKTGQFKGSFKVFAETDEGKSKKLSATVFGAVVDGVGYGTATVKKVGSLPVTVE